LVQGSDIWLNTPLRPQEASGTSGMKVLPNGGLNLSILDGWWDEAWQDAAAEKRFIGWAIGNGESYTSHEEQDQVESAALYALLEHDIVPGFYERSADGLPRRWIAQMKSSISTLCPTFNMQRMVRQYAADFYVTADERYQQLTANGSERARALAVWTSHIQAHWKEVCVESVDSLTNAELPVGGRLHVRAHVHLGALTPDQVAVELYVGRLDADGELTRAHTIPMQPVGTGSSAGSGGTWAFEAATVPCPTSGLHGYTVRITPFHVDQPKTFLPGVITWADAAGKLVAV
jgi:starch phosphorylase